MFLETLISILEIQISVFQIQISAFKYRYLYSNYKCRYLYLNHLSLIRDICNWNADICIWNAYISIYEPGYFRLLFSTKNQYSFAHDCCNAWRLASIRVSGLLYARNGCGFHSFRVFLGSLRILFTEIFFSKTQYAYGGPLVSALASDAWGPVRSLIWLKKKFWSEYAPVSSLVGNMLMKSNVLRIGTITGGPVSKETSPV